MDEQLKTTAEKPISNTKLEIIKECRRIEESSLYSSKGHFFAAYCWTKFNLCLGLLIVVLAAVTGHSFIRDDSLAGSALSLLIAVFTAIMTFLNPNEKASCHLNAGNSYDAMQNEVRIFRSVDCWREDSEQILTERLKNYSKQKDKLNQGSPQIPWWAYKIASKGVESGEGSYEVDKEEMSIKIADQIPKKEKKKVFDQPTNTQQ